MATFDIMDDHLADSDPLYHTNASPSAQPSAPAADPYADKRNAVQQWYQGYLGRQGSPDEINGWAMNPNFGTVQQSIANSLEAQNYRTKQAQPASAPAATTSPYAWIDDALRSVQSTDDPNYWYRVISEHGDLNNPAAMEYWKDRIRRGDGSALVKAGQLSTFQDHGAAGGPPSVSGTTAFSDPATQQWEQLIRSLVDKLNTPTPQSTLELQQTQALDPLERQRQQSRDQEAQKLAQRGITPDSGIFREAMTNIDRQFNELRTRTQAGFANTAAQNEENRALNAVNLFQRIPNYQDTRLSLAQNALMPANPAQLLNLQQNYQQMANQNAQYSSAQNQAFWQWLGTVLAGSF